MNATYITKNSTGRVHLTVPGAQHGSFFSDGYGAAGHVYSPADDYTLCGNLTRRGYTAGEQTTDGAEATCKVCTKRFVSLSEQRAVRFAIKVSSGYISRLGGGYQVTDDVSEAIQFDNTDVARAYVNHFSVPVSFKVVAA